VGHPILLEQLTKNEWNVVRTVRKKALLEKQNGVAQLVEALRASRDVVGLILDFVIGIFH
jgi:hypothetical protein